MIEMASEQLKGPDVGWARDLQARDDWVVDLDEDDIAEIDAALAIVKSHGATVPFDRELFRWIVYAPPSSASSIWSATGTALRCCGGLPRERYTPADCELIYWGIGCHLGTAVSQSPRGDMIGYVRDEGVSMGDPNARGYKTAGELQFHCDQLPTDILGLFCVNDARSGGESHIVSALAIHNVIRGEHPDLLPHLYEPINVDWRGDEPEGQPPWYRVPMFSVADGKITSRFTNASSFVRRCDMARIWRRLRSNGPRSSLPIRWPSVPRCA